MGSLLAVFEMDTEWLHTGTSLVCLSQLRFGDRLSWSKTTLGHFTVRIEFVFRAWNQSASFYILNVTLMLVSLYDCLIIVQWGKKPPGAGCPTQRGFLPHVWGKTPPFGNCLIWRWKRLAPSHDIIPLLKHVNDTQQSCASATTSKC